MSLSLLKINKLEYKIVNIFKHKNIYIYHYFFYILNKNHHFKRMLDYLKNKILIN